MNKRKVLMLQKQGRGLIEEQFSQRLAGNYHIADQIGNEIERTVDALKDIGYEPTEEGK